MQGVTGQTAAGAPKKVAAYQQLQTRLDPFALAEAIDRKLACIYRLANHRQSPRPASPQPPARRAAHTTVGRSVTTAGHHHVPVPSRMAR